ncbi:MAG: hypothetical protein ABJA67_18285 [Chthonomonadales bacterium]
MRILYRADGGHPIGTGHLFRALRILDRITQLGGVDVILAVSDEAAPRKILQNASFKIEWLPPRTDLESIKPHFKFDSIANIVEELRPDVVVVDMLDTDASEIKQITEKSIPVVTFDDRGDGRLLTSILINILVEEPYPPALPTSVRLLQGGPYVTLSDEFADESSVRIVPEPELAKRILVTMGGADAVGLNCKVAEALAPIREIERVEFVVGPAFQHQDQLIAILEKAEWESKILRSAPSLLPHYKAAEFGIIAGGLAMYEVCRCGLPSLFVPQPIDHQIELSEIMRRAGAVAYVGPGTEITSKDIRDCVESVIGDQLARTSMAANGVGIVDGRGTDRVAESILSLVKE